MNDTEFKTIANKMIEEQIQAREIACERLIEEAGETISRLYELIKQCKKAKNASPLYYPTIDVESVADRVERLNGGFAKMKSARMVGWQSLKKVSALYLPRSASIPRIARFICAIFHVVGLESCP